MADQFREAYIRFKNLSGYTEPVEWSQWASINDVDIQTAILYCQFYDQITLAWYKARAEFVPDEDGLSCVLQYIIKNVPRIQAEEAKFTPAYMYRIAYNCMDCLRYVQRDINRYTTETTNVVVYDGEELDLCDLVPHRDTSYEDQVDKDRFWSIIASMGPEVEKVVNHLVNDESLRRVSKRSSAYEEDPLADVSVSESRMNEIIEILKDRLEEFKPVFY